MLAAPNGLEPSLGFSLVWNKGLGQCTDLEGLGWGKGTLLTQLKDPPLQD